MRRANKSKHNSIGELLNISNFTGSRTAPVITAENRMLRRLKGERRKENRGCLMQRNTNTTTTTRIAYGIAQKQKTDAP